MKIAISVRSILVKVWQKNLAPKQAGAAILRKIISNCGCLRRNCDLCRIYESRLFNLLNELKIHNVNATETEEDIQLFCDHLEKHKFKKLANAS